MKRFLIIGFLVLLITTISSAQTFENDYTRSLSDIMNDVAKHFNIRLKYDMDTTNIKVKFADFRLRPYSLEETLTNILSPLDFKAIYQKDNLWKVKRYEYPRRTAEDGRKLINYLTTLSPNIDTWETRRNTLKKEVRKRLKIDELLTKCTNEKPLMGKIRKHDGYTVQNFSLPTLDGYTIKGSIYTPKTKGKHPLIICPIGHFLNGRYNKDLQLRYGSLARMGAICVSYDLWGGGESEDEVGKEAHHTSMAHRMQAINGLKILDWIIQRKDVDRTRVGINGGSGGGSQTVLLSVLDDRFTAACPVVSVSAWFDGGCPCESGMPIQLAAGGTCNAELAATFAPKPMMLVSDGGDWTATTPEVEYPFIQHIYELYNAKEKVQNIHLAKERHDFGENKRHGVYRFFIDTFALDASMLDESKVTIEDENTLRFNK